MAVTASLSASRITGVAPLFVFFNATSTVADGVSYPFHHLDYSWDFGDPAGGATWTYGAQSGMSKNVAKGPVAAHVFETAGTYTVTLTVTDINGNTDVEEVEITVAAWDDATHGDTVCISNSESTADDVAGSDHITSSNFNTAMATALASYKRILFKRGDTFTVSSSVALTVEGPGIIGAYGSGNVPVIDGATDIFVLGGATPNINDWRLMDLKLDMNGAAFGDCGIGRNGSFQQLLVLRVEIAEAGIGIDLSTTIIDDRNRSLGSTAHEVFQEIGIVECYIHDQNDNACIYVEGAEFGVLGSRLDTIAQASGHISRYVFLSLAVIQHNLLARPVGTTHAMKLHGPPWPNLTATYASGATTITINGNGEDYFGHLIEGPGIPAGTYRTGGSANSMTISQATTSAQTNVAITATGVSNRYSDGYSDRIVISDNEIIGSEANATQIVAIEPQSASSSNRHDRLRDIIVERNYIRAAFSGSNVGVLSHCDTITIRNNLFVMTSATDGYAVRLRKGSPVVPAPVTMWVYNNTAYQLGGSSFTFLDIEDADVEDVECANNVAWSPDAAVDFVAGTGIDITISPNNSSDSQMGAAVGPFDSQTPSALADFKVSGGSPSSYPYNGGTSVAVFEDFFGTARPQGAAMDMGFSEFEESDSGAAVHVMRARSAMRGGFING